MENKLEVSLEIIVHATEEVKKILDSAYELFEIKEDEFLQENLTGHYGNPILLLKAKLAKKRAEEFIQRLVSKISKPQLDEFINDIQMYFEDSSLFLRIGKQALVRKLVNLQQNDAVKIKISTPVYRKYDLAKTYLELLKS